MARRPDLRSGPARLVALVAHHVPPMHPAGLPFVGAGLAVAAAGRTQPVAAPRRSGFGRGANAAFFRHPPRVPPTRPGVVVAPADGLICLIEEAVPPAELEPARTAAAADQHLPVDVRRARAARPDQR